MAALILVAAGLVLPTIAVAIAAARRETYVFPVFAAGLAFFAVEAGSLLLFFAGALTCDEGCEDPPEVWRDDPGAWQWSAIWIAGLVAFVAGAVALFALALRRHRLAAWSAATLVVAELFAWGLLL